MNPMTPHLLPSATTDTRHTSCRLRAAISALMGEICCRSNKQFKTVAKDNVVDFDSANVATDAERSRIAALISGESAIAIGARVGINQRAARLRQVGLGWSSIVLQRSEIRRFRVW